MDGFSSKDMMYGIIGATLSDKRSDSDAKLPRNELMKIGLMNALGAASKNPIFSMLTAKMAADSKIEAATAVAKNLVLEAELRKYKDEIKTIKGLTGDTAIAAKFTSTFDVQGHFLPVVTQ